MPLASSLDRSHRHWLHTLGSRAHTDTDASGSVSHTEHAETVQARTYTHNKIKTRHRKSKIEADNVGVSKRARETDGARRDVKWKRTSWTTQRKKTSASAKMIAIINNEKKEQKIFVGERWINITYLFVQFDWNHHHPFNIIQEQIFSYSGEARIGCDTIARHDKCNERSIKCNAIQIDVIWQVRKRAKKELKASVARSHCIGIRAKWKTNSEIPRVFSRTICCSLLHRTMIHDSYAERTMTLRLSWKQTSSTSLSTAHLCILM